MWKEFFRYDEMGRLTKMWYDVRNPNSFASNDPVSGTNPFDHKVDWTLGKVYERDAVVKTTYGGGVTTTNYTDNLHYQVTAGPATMAWNDNGHLTDRGSDDFAWTALGQLRQAAISGETARDYTYDAFGRRVKTVVGSQTNRFLYDGWHMIGEYDSTAGHWLWQEGPWCEGERMLEHVARDTNDLDTDSNTTEYRTYAVHEDFQDTVWGLSDTGAAVIERYFYTDPYGASETKNAAGTNIGAFATNVFHRKRLHGGVVEAASKLYDYRKRWLDNVTGTWSAHDALLRDAYNLYQSFLSNPISYSDTFGLAVGSQNQESKDPWNDCYQPDSAEPYKCPKGVSDKMSDICTKVKADFPGGNLLVVGAWKLICDTKIYCNCRGCTKRNADGSYSWTAGLTANAGNGIAIYYSPDIGAELDRWKRGGIDVPTPPRNEKEKCCPCGDVENTLFHEFGHALCLQLQGTKCGHTGDPAAPIEGLGEAWKACLNSGDPGSQACTDAVHQTGATL